MLYSAFIIFVYAFLDELYKSKNEIPLAVSNFFNLLKEIISC